MTGKHLALSDRVQKLLRRLHPYIAKFPTVLEQPVQKLREYDTGVTESLLKLARNTEAAAKECLTDRLEVQRTRLKTVEHRVRIVGGLIEAREAYFETLEAIATQLETTGKPW